MVLLVDTDRCVGVVLGDTERRVEVLGGHGEWYCIRIHGVNVHTDVWLPLPPIHDVDTDALVVDIVNGFELWGEQVAWLLQRQGVRVVLLLQRQGESVVRPPSSPVEPCLLI